MDALFHPDLEVMDSLMLIAFLCTTLIFLKYLAVRYITLWMAKYWSLALLDKTFIGNGVAFLLGVVFYHYFLRRQQAPEPEEQWVLMQEHNGNRQLDDSDERIF